MDRELVLAILLIALTGAIVQLGAWWPAIDFTIVDSAWQAERRCWYRVWAPVAPTVIVLCAAAGWAVLEPSNAERVPRTIVLISVPFAFVWLRALWRAGKALLRRPIVRTAGVLGVWRARIVVSDEFRALLDERAMRAAIAHEQAHLSHRDNIRLWLAQFATDLQWPSSRARARFDAWRRVLEFARDDDVRCSGIDGADLAAAIIAGAKLNWIETVAPALLAERTDFPTRITRLLDDPPPAMPVPESILPFLLVVAPVLLAIAVAGAHSGETLVRVVFSALP